MIGLIQRVTRAAVHVEGQCIARIGRGLLVLVGVRHGDERRNALRLAERLLGYRVFPDATGRMNRSVCEVGGGILLVPQFTLCADTRKGMRPSFTDAAEPRRAQALFALLVETVAAGIGEVGTGRFGADMQVELVNDGPVTFWIEG